MKGTICTLGLVMAIVLFSVCTACRSVRRGEPVRRAAVLNSPTLEHGRVVFQHHCDRCHPGGEGGLGPSLNDKPAPRWLMETQVRVGLGAMPGFNHEQISSEDLKQLMDYVIALRKAPKTETARN